MKKILMVFLAMVVAFYLQGCIMAKHKASVEKGLLVQGLNREAFLKVWGQPSETTTITSIQFHKLMGLDKDDATIAPFKKLVMLNVWIYDERKTLLVFYGYRLTAWTIGDNYRDGLKRVYVQENEKALKDSKPGVNPKEPSKETNKERKILTVNWTFANVRSGAGDNYPVVTTVKQGDKLTVIGESGEWFNVQLESGQQGWISNRVVK